MMLEATALSIGSRRLLLIERLGAGFGGGMNLGGMCGAASGAIMVLGLALCDSTCDTGEGREPITAAVQEFAESYRSYRAG